MADGINMICPKCGHFQQKAAVCTVCAVVVAKVTLEGVRKPPAINAEPPQEHQSAGNMVHEHGQLSRGAQVFAKVIGLVVFVGLYYLVSPAEMSLSEFVSAKKSGGSIRSFEIQATVDLDEFPHVVEAQSTDGFRLSSLKLVGDNTTGFVTYDPRVFDVSPKVGDVVSITGRFERVPYYDGSVKPRTFTVASASSISILASSDNLASSLP